MKDENVDSREKAKINQKICVTCRRALSMSEFSYYRSLSGRGSVLSDSCDGCAGILPPESAKTTGYNKKSKEPKPARLAEGQPIILDSDAITSLLVGVVAWLATKNTTDDKEIMGRLLVGPKPSYHHKQNGYGAS